MVVAIYIGPSGAIDRLEVETGSLPKELQELILTQFSGVRFKPGIKDGQPVASRLRFEVTVRPLAPIVPPPTLRERKR